MPTRAVLPYGSGAMEFPLPESWRVDVARVPAPPSVSPIEAAAHALRAPVAGPRLAGIVRPGMRVTVVIPDATRACPTPALLPALLAELAEGGVGAESVTVLVALGMHRRLRPEEREGLIGPLARTLRVEEAHGDDEADYVDLGTLEPRESGFGISIPVRLHPLLRECDLLVSLGLVEPHQYAGWSGGRKAVAIGCAGASTIAALHGSAVLEHAGTRLGVLDGNPLHRALTAIAGRAGLRFVLNAALDGDERVIGLAAGEPEAVLADLVARARPYVESPVTGAPYDVVLAGVGPPKDVNLYQASRALTYIAFAPEPVAREGGWIVTAAACPEGAGRGPGEEEFLRAMGGGRDPMAVLDGLRRGGFAAGGQRAVMVAKTLERHRLMVVGARDPQVVRACGMESAPDAAAAAALLTATLPAAARVLVVPRALAILPVPR